MAGTVPPSQSDPASRTDGMRAPPHGPAPRALFLPLLPLLALLAVAASVATAATVTIHFPLQYQTYILCKQTTSHLCVAWPEAAEPENAGDDLSSSESWSRCGLVQSPDIATPPDVYTIKGLEDGKVKTVYCDVVIINGEDEDTSKVKKVARVRRQTGGLPRGRYRGQTQSQYLAVDRGGKDEGKAEAHSAADSSRASVSGNSGMGQAQSQSMYEPSCDDCYDNLKNRPQEGNGFSRYGPGQNGRPGWIGPQNSGGPAGNTYATNQNARPGLDIYGRAQPTAPNYERGYGVPPAENGLTSGGSVGPSQSRNQGFFPGSGGTGVSQGGPHDSFRPGLGGSITGYGPSQRGNGFGPNQQTGQEGIVRPELGSRYDPHGSDSVGYGPGQAGVPGSENYPPGSLMRAPGRGGLSSVQPGGTTLPGGDGTLMPNQVGVPGQVYNQMGQRGPGYGSGGSSPGIYGPGQSSPLTPNINSEPLQGGSRNIIPAGVPGVGYGPNQGVTSGSSASHPPQGGNWPVTSYSPGNSPYFCCVVGPDGKLIPAGGTPFNRGTDLNNQYPNINNQYGYGGQIPGSTDQGKGIGNMPRQAPYGGSGNGVNNLGQGPDNNYGLSQGPGQRTYMTGTGQVPQGGTIEGPGHGTMSGNRDYIPNQNIGSYSPGTTGGSRGYAPNVLSPDQARPDVGGAPMNGGGYRMGQGSGPNTPNSGTSYGPISSGGPGTGGYSPVGSAGETKQYIPGQPSILGGDNSYVQGQGGVPMGNRNFASGSPGGVGGYLPGQDGRPTTTGNYGPGQGNNLGGGDYGPGQAPENIRSYKPSQILGPGGAGYGVRPGDRTGFYNNYGPHQTEGPEGNLFSPGSGVNPQSGGSYGPGQSGGIEGSNVGPNLNSRPDSTASFGPGQNVGPENIGYGNYRPGQNGGSGGYNPDLTNNMGSYGPGGGLGHGPSGDVGGGSYGPYQSGSQGPNAPGQSGVESYQPSLGGKPGDGYSSVGIPGDGGRFSNGQPIYEMKNRYGVGPVGNGYNTMYPGQNNNYNGVAQNFTDVGNLADGDDSEAEASVSQAANGTTASATSRGGNDKGRAQTNVQGTYTGSGSFSAQAQITGENKEAESQVTGGKKGASSSAQGSGRNNKSQANVQLGSETGSVQTQSLTSGAYHSSNSQVQGSVKGGMADAQARGPGSTSSQAQIGFTPYKDGDKSHDTQKIPFVGGGVASAQSSGRTGQSQSQLHGTFRYGITYNGAAQAGGSVDKDAVFPNRLSFDKIDVFDENEKNINVDTEKPIDLDIPAPVDTTHSLESVPSEEPLPPVEESSTDGISALDTVDTVDETQKDDETLKNSETRYSSHTHLDHHKPNGAAATLPDISGVTRSFQSRYDNNGGEYEYTTDREEAPADVYDTDGAEEEQGEYNYDEIPRDTLTHQSLQSPRKTLDVRQSTGGNTQHIVLGSLGDHDAEITQKSSERPDETKTYQPGERVPGTGGYTIPAGFTGSVKSVASKEKTYVVGSRESPSQAQTVTLTPGSGRVRYAPPSGYGRVAAGQLRSLVPPRDDRYVSVSKSVARDLDADNNVRKQYSHSYYTKSSSCGFFTFTCTMVSGAEGKKKVCRPKIPTNPDGTPIKC